MTIELVGARDKDRRRMNTEECVEDGYTREKEDRATENKVGKRDMKITGLRAGEEMDRAMWSRKIISHTRDPI